MPPRKRSKNVHKSALKLKKSKATTSEEPSCVDPPSISVQSDGVTGLGEGTSSLGKQVILHNCHINISHSNRCHDKYETTQLMAVHVAYRRLLHSCNNV